MSSQEATQATQVPVADVIEKKMPVKRNIGLKETLIKGANVYLYYGWPITVNQVQVEQLRIVPLGRQPP